MTEAFPSMCMSWVWKCVRLGKVAAPADPHKSWIWVWVRRSWAITPTCERCNGCRPVRQDHSTRWRMLGLEVGKVRLGQASTIVGKICYWELEQLLYWDAVTSVEHEIQGWGQPRLLALMLTSGSSSPASDLPKLPKLSLAYAGRYCGLALLSLLPVLALM